jgi:hypothetical protein
LTVGGPASSSPATAPVDYGNDALINKSWRARVAVPTAGLYLYRWTVTGTGATVLFQQASVAPALDAVDPRLSYATSTDYAERFRAAPPLGIDRMLRDASERIDDAIMCTIYNVDDQDMPTDEKIREALRAATCEQAKWRDSIGDDDTAALYQSLSIAGVSMTRATSASGTTAAIDRLGPDVRPILAKMGLIGQGPWTY